MTSRFPPSSRYYATEITQTAGDHPVAYLRRRFISPPSNFSLLSEHVVQGGERVDTLTATYLDDPEQFWRLCDGNGVLRPTELTDDVGEPIRITLPEGIEAPRSA